FSSGRSNATKLLLSFAKTIMTGVFSILSWMILSAFNLFQSYTFLFAPAFTPITHDLSFHERLSVPVSSSLLFPLSNFVVLSYDFINAESACMINEFGFNRNHSANEVCVLKTWGNCCPFNFPAMASPVTWRHQLFVVTS